MKRSYKIILDVSEFFLYYLCMILMFSLSFFIIFVKYELKQFMYQFGIYFFKFLKFNLSLSFIFYFFIYWFIKIQIKLTVKIDKRLISYLQIKEPDKAYLYSRILIFISVLLLFTIFTAFLNNYRLRYEIKFINMIFFLLFYISPLIIAIIGGSSISVKHLALIYCRKYLENKQKSDLEKTFRFINSIYNNKISIETIYQTINIITALDSIGINEHHKIINSLMSNLESQNNNLIFEDTMKLIKLKDNITEIEDIIVETKLPLIYKMKTELSKNWFKLFYTPLLLYVLFILFKNIFGIELPI